MTPLEIALESALCGVIGVLMVMFIAVRGVPLRMGLARLRHRTFLIVDNDTHYDAPAVKKEWPEGIETKDGRVWGKAFRTKMLNGIKLGIAVPDDFILYEPAMARAVEEDNAAIEDPEKYVKMEESQTKVKFAGKLVAMHELTKGITKLRSPLLIKSVMTRAAQEAVLAKEREPAKWGMLILMVCLGLGFLAILLAKSGLI